MRVQVVGGWVLASWATIVQGGVLRTIWFRVQGSRLMVQGSGFRVQGAGFRV